MLKLLLASLAVPFFLALSLPARADKLALGVSPGVVAVGAGRGSYTLGVGGSWAKTIGPFTYGLRGSIAATGFAGSAPGGFGRGDVAIGAELGKNVWLDVGVGGEVLSYRACGPLNCGRITGIVPAAAARLVIFGAYFDRALGLSVEGGAFYVLHSQAREGISASIAAGPLWRFGGST